MRNHTRAEEYLETVKKDRNEIAGNIVRITTVLKPTWIDPELQELYLVSTYLTTGFELVRFVDYCGEWWNGKHSENEVIEQKAKEKESIIENACRALGLDVRNGIIEPQ
jgi:hypothetical protein